MEKIREFVSRNFMVLLLLSIRDNSSFCIVRSLKKSIPSGLLFKLITKLIFKFKTSKMFTMFGSCKFPHQSSAYSTQHNRFMCYALSTMLIKINESIWHHYFSFRECPFSQAWVIVPRPIPCMSSLIIQYTSFTCMFCTIS